MSAPDLLLSWLLTLALHATGLLALAWLLERLGALRHPGWRELAWRGALFGALLSSLGATANQRMAVTATPEPSVPAATEVAPRDEGGQPVPANPARALRATLPGESGLPQALARRQSDTQRNLASAGERDALPADAAPVTLSLPLALASALLLAWALGGLPVALRLAGQARALVRWTRSPPGRPASAATGLAQIVEGLGRAMGLDHLPGLRLVDGLSSPMLLPGRRLLLPSWVCDLDPVQQRALLAHELTHLQRHDPAWRLAQRLAVLPLYFHPLAWLALRRLEALSEDACDERAATLCGSGRPLAECLAACLAHGTRPTTVTPTLAVAMAAEPGPVVRRVRNLLEPTPMNRPIPRTLRRTALVVGLAAALALPGLAITSVANPAYAEGFLSGLFQGTSVTETDTKSHYVHRNGRTGERIEMTLRGDVVFTEAEDDIAAISGPGEFELSIKRGGVERSLQVLPGKDGLEREYRVDGKKQAFDADARAWLAKSLPHLLRETAFQAETRGKRFLARGGAGALMDEIDKIQGDHARGKYLAVLFGNARLDDSQLQRAMALAAGIGSDYELRQALSAGLDNQAMTPSGQVRLLETATKIGSDYELAQLLVQLAKAQPLQGPALQAWRTALASIGSDYEQRRVLSVLLDKQDPAAARLALESAAAIGSDYEARQVLEKSVAMARADADVRVAWFRILDGIGSDYEQRQALQALIDAGPVDAGLAGDVLDALADIGSGYEVSQVLRELAAVMPGDAALIERYRAVARRLSDHERGQAERALDRFSMALVD
ncbi:M56 family metallopeptidase [Arenimonas donghaensis]|uniref:Peptidase M56 domain-containing protein n=1 Tax=Arenimonas donghaensis DSM 18148 = HO3-R19 TaxID=1121014 RepID=A0A087MH29_9GAMM|nr:M56 family metallopeptidase [Arenimonas donghaensis]KFL36182.1 hypothetical protein N788_04655 [Arenimonas donghaensis DSM 18148 = HO3-R19]